MKLRIFAFVAIIALAGCFAGSSRIGPGAGLNSAAEPIGAGGMAGPGSPSAFGGSGAAAGSDADVQGATDAGTTGSDKGGGAADPTAGDDSPMTMVGSPMGTSRKPEPCPRDFHLCFHNLTMTATPGDETGHLHYEIAGFLETKTTGGDIAGAPHAIVTLIDLLFPDNQVTSRAGKPLGDFSATVDAPSSRGLRFEAEFCQQTATLDATLPELAASPLVLDSCGATGRLPLDRSMEFKSRLMEE